MGLWWLFSCGPWTGSTDGRLGLERRLVRANTWGGPRVVRRCAAGRRGLALLTLRRGGPGVVVGGSALAATLTTAVRRPARALRPGDLRSGVAQGRTDLVDLDLEDRALLALARLVLTRAQVALHDDAHALLQGLRDVLRGLPPDRAGQEQGLAVLPLVALAVEGARRRGDPEVGHRSTRGGEAELGVVDEVADHGDLGVACHVRSPRVCDTRSGSSWRG